MYKKTQKNKKNLTKCTIRNKMKTIKVKCLMFNKETVNIRRKGGTILEAKELQKKSDLLRLEAVRMVYEGKDGHPGPALSIADIVATLYFDIMNIDPKNPEWSDRDRFILSKGHACPIWYAALNERGYFEPKVEHFHLRQLGSMFQGHPSMHSTAGVDMTSGSLGNGIAIGAGMALAAKIQKKDYFTYVIVGDGELQEGICWEGVNVATGRGLDNLVVFVDRNGWQSYKSVEYTVGLNNIADRFRAFGWDVQEICGHDHDAIKEAVAKAKTVSGKPHCIVCDDVKGKGVSFMENNNAWHKGVPTDEEWAIVQKELGGEE